MKANGVLRKLRALLSIGLTWSVVWTTIFAAIGVTVGIFDPDSIDPGETLSRIAGIGAIVGFASGIGFASLLWAGDRRKTLRDLSVLRAAVWGGLGSAAFPLLTSANNSMVLILCPIGAAVAAVTVAMAKRGELSAPAERPTLPR